MPNSTEKTKNEEWVKGVACGVQKVYGDFKVVDLVTLQFLNFWGQVFFFFFFKRNKLNWLEKKISVSSVLG